MLPRSPAAPRSRRRSSTSPRTRWTCCYCCYQRRCLGWQRHARIWVHASRLSRRPRRRLGAPPPRRSTRRRRSTRQSRRPAAGTAGGGGAGAGGDGLGGCHGWAAPGRARCWAGDAARTTRSSLAANRL